jgi:hypothetical protein
MSLITDHLCPPPPYFSPDKILQIFATAQSRKQRIGPVGKQGYNPIDPPTEII